MVGIIIGIVIGIIIGDLSCAAGIIGYKPNTTTTNNGQASGNSVTEENDTISEQEAITKGKELYDKATKVYETWQLLPYCGERVTNEKTVNFKSGSTMYESNYKNLEELKNYLSTFLSEEIINSHIKETAITDETILDTPGKEYTNYLVKDGKLYCRSNSGKGWLSRYLDNYEIKVNTIKDDIIIYDVKLANVSEYTATQTNSKCTYDSKISDCKENEIEYVDTKFIIKKINDNWVVTDYTLHD